MVRSRSDLGAPPSALVGILNRLHQDADLEGDLKSWDGITKYLLQDCAPRDLAEAATYLDEVISDRVVTEQHLAQLLIRCGSDFGFSDARAFFRALRSEIGIRIDRRA